MALIKTLEMDNGITLTNGYSRIYKIVQDVSLYPCVNIHVNIYFDKNAYLDTKPEVCSFSYKVTNGEYTTYFSEDTLKETGKSLYTQSQMYLQSLSFYQGSVVSD